MKILSIVPSRISLFGGGTDVEPYASQYGGLCLNMAINIRHKVILGGESKLTEEDTPDFIKAFTDLNVYHEYDNSIEGGLGSSAALAVALTAADARYKGEKLALNEIAEKAWDIEVNKVGLYGGKQDHFCSAFGGVNVMEFNKDGVGVTPLAKGGFIEKIFPSLVLFYTGFKRKSAVIQEAFKDLNPEKKFALDAIKATAVRAIDPIAQGDIKALGSLLDESWELKKMSNGGVSNKEIDDLYEKGKKLGALGGKICGAGSGGHFLFVVPPEKKDKFIKDMELKWVDFAVSWDGVGVRII